MSRCVVGAICQDKKHGVHLHVAEPDRCWDCCNDIFTVLISNLNFTRHEDDLKAKKKWHYPQVDPDSDFILQDTSESTTLVSRNAILPLRLSRQALCRPIPKFQSDRIQSRPLASTDWQTLSALAKQLSGSLCKFDQICCYYNVPFAYRITS